MSERFRNFSGFPGRSSFSLLASVLATNWIGRNISLCEADLYLD
jgi:hypothetical protein